MCMRRADIIRTRCAVGLIESSWSLHHFLHLPIHNAIVISPDSHPKGMITAVLSVLGAALTTALVTAGVESGVTSGQLPTLGASLAPAGRSGTGVMRLRLSLIVPEGWHIAAENPGTGGLATRLQWQLPTIWSLSDVRWAVPLRSLDGKDTLYTYAGRADVYASFIAPEAARRQPVTAIVSYGLCRDVCIPGVGRATWTP